MECKKNFMLMILSESHKESINVRVAKKRKGYDNRKKRKETLPMAAVRNIGQ